MSHAMRLAYVGSRTTRARNARGEGVSVYAMAGEDGAWTLRQHVAGLLNPSFLAIDHAGATLYAVHGDASEVSAFRIDRDDGTLSFIGRAGTRGRNPVHLAIDPQNRHVIIANHLTVGEYVSGLTVIALSPEGGFGEVTDHLPMSGEPGPHRHEQPFAKPHQCLFDPSGAFIAVPDKGLDFTACYRLDAQGRLHAAQAPPARSRECEGPRHIAFHPTEPHAYALNELSSTITACRFDSAIGALTPHQIVSSLPDTFTGFSRAAEIEVSPDGRFVYASNRGADSIGVFAIDAATGRLSARGWTESGGRTPRFFTLSPSGRHLFAANEDSDTIVRFARDAASGLLSNPLVVASTGSPTCILLRG